MSGHDRGLRDTVRLRFHPLAEVRRNHRPVVTVRDPVATVSSWRRLGWTPRLAELLAEPALVRDRLARFAPELEAALADGADGVDGVDGPACCGGSSTGRWPATGPRSPAWRWSATRTCRPTRCRPSPPCTGGWGCRSSPTPSGRSWPRPRPGRAAGRCAGRCRPVGVQDGRPPPRQPGQPPGVARAPHPPGGGPRPRADRRRRRPVRLHLGERQLVGPALELGPRPMASTRSRTDAPACPPGPGRSPRACGRGRPARRCGRGGQPAGAGLEELATIGPAPTDDDLQTRDGAPRPDGPRCAPAPGARPVRPPPAWSGRPA